MVFAALALAALPPLLGMGPWLMWVQRALNFLVVSCPCALVISIPLSFFGGIGGASKQGILVKGGNYLEALAKADIVVFDKTGTLTKGTFEVTAVHPQQVSEGELLELAALAERFSDHPISRSIQAACQTSPAPSRVADAKEIAGEMGAMWMSPTRACISHGESVEATRVRTMRDWWRPMTLNVSVGAPASGSRISP